MTDIVRIRDKYYVRATSALADARVCILKYGSTIAVLNRFGDIEGAGFGQTGVYHQETRHLSRFTLHLNGLRPLLLNSVMHEDNSYLSVDLANPEVSLKSGGSLPPQTVHFYRAKFVHGDTLYDQLRIDNYGSEAVRVQVSVAFEADFADIFEIRGTKRERHGARLDDVVGRAHAVLSYRGLDEIVRRTMLRFSPAPDFVSGRQARYELDLQPKQEVFLQINASCEQGAPRHVVDDSGSPPGERAFARLRESLRATRNEECRVRSPSPDYEAWFERSRNDLHLLTVGNVEGRYPYAGVPWFNTVFGRDGIITAFERLWMAPEVARDVLMFLASCQAKTEDPERDSQPGKILHELRRGEMANTRDVPFGCYYGSVDSTPLFVLLAGAYLIRTADLDLIRDLWPNIEAALEWTVRYGDADGDGFVEYSRRSKTGLVHQGWKDSGDSIFHKDGQEARPPIALCEVQAYVYAARRLAAQMARDLGKVGRAEELDRSAEELRTRFETAFWDEGIGMYALALDGNKGRCRVRTSNAGQTLFCGIADPQHAARVRDGLMSRPMYTGWGVRTLSAEEARYNPMSYHNGSVWPHDNALIALGFAAYGFQEDAATLLGGINEASRYFDLRRLPELYCGFHKRADSTGPTKYPVACSPQAWSAGAAFLLLQASLGMSVRARESRVDFVNPHLPCELNEVMIENLQVGEGAADIVVRRDNGVIKIEAVRKAGQLEIRTTPM
jgi:glycogen debranching enzyme